MSDSTEMWKRLLVIPLVVAITAAVIAWVVGARPVGVFIIVFPVTQIILAVVKARQNAERGS